MWEDLGQQIIWGLGEILPGLLAAFVAVRSRHRRGRYGGAQLGQGSSWGSSQIRNAEGNEMFKREDL